MLPPREPLPRLFLRFLRFGALAWGGPVAQIGMIQRELVEEATPTRLFLSGLKAGSLTFGGAYTAIPFLQRDAVERGRWLSMDVFLDGVSVGVVGLIAATLLSLGRAGLTSEAPSGRASSRNSANVRTSCARLLIAREPPS